MFVVKCPHSLAVYARAETVPKVIDAYKAAVAPVKVTHIVPYGDARSGLRTTLAALQGQYGPGVTVNMVAVVDVEEGDNPALATYMNVKDTLDAVNYWTS